MPEATHEIDVISTLDLPGCVCHSVAFGDRYRIVALGEEGVHTAHINYDGWHGVPVWEIGQHIPLDGYCETVGISEVGTVPIKVFVGTSGGGCHILEFRNYNLSDLHATGDYFRVGTGSTFAAEQDKRGNMIVCAGSPAGQGQLVIGRLVGIPPSRRR